MVGTTANKIQYTANGSNTIFAFPYSFFGQADLKVYLTDLDGEDTLQALTTDYTLDPIGDNYRNGANVVFDSAPTNNYKVTIIRDLDIEQQTDYQDYSKFPADVFENDVDRRTMVEQQLEEELKRTLRTPITDPSSIGLMPKATDRSSKFLAFDASGDPIAAEGIPDVPATTFGASLIDDLDAAAARITLDALQKSILTNKGDLLVQGADDPERLAAVTTGRVLTAKGVGAIPQYIRLFDAFIGAGELFMWDGSAVLRLIPGALDTYIKAQGVGELPVYSTIDGIYEQGGAKLLSKLLTLTFSTETFKEVAHGLTVANIRGISGIPPAVGAIRITELGYGTATTELRMTVSASVSGTAYIIVSYIP